MNHTKNLFLIVPILNKGKSMKIIIIIMLLLSPIYAETFKDIEIRRDLYLKFADETEDEDLKQFWKDKADVESADILFMQKYCRGNK